MPSLPPGIATACADGLRLRVRLTPGAGGNEIAGTGIMGDGTACLKVRVTAIAEGGKANAAMINRPFLLSAGRIVRRFPLQAILHRLRSGLSCCGPSVPQR